MTTHELVAISGSAVRDSSTDLLVEAAAAGWTEALPNTVEARVTAVRPGDLEIIPCQACGESPDPDWCFYRDSLYPALEAIARCDALVVGSPIYFDAMSAQLKLLVDRCNCFRPPDYANRDPNHAFLKRLTRKRPGGIILVGAEGTWFEGARRSLAGWLKWIEVTNEGMVVFDAPIDDFRRRALVADYPEVLAQARKLGRHLASRVVG